MYFLKLSFDYGCKAFKQIKKSIDKILTCASFGEKNNKCTLDLILLQIPDIFYLFIAFIGLFIGAIYACIALVLLFVATLASVPFNYLIAW
tara:strand:- start:839 stop:1111 length:273 start_codon:yes stop_codon:yes gene_type:complete